MGYRLGYSGPEVDVLLQKAYKYSVVNNGWAKLDSSDSNPVDLNSLVTQGNYSISFWNNGPVQLNTSGPINVCVTKDSSNGKTYQTIYDAGKVYLRETTGTSFSNTWIEEQNNTDLDINASVPQNPQDNYVWIDTSGEEPTIKVYKESTHSWIATSAADLAKASVYDPQGIKQPIDTYLNQKIADADLNKAEEDYNAHLVTITDGINWTEGTISSTSREWYSVCYGNGKFVAVAFDSNYFAYSTDGINWTESTISSSTSRRWQSVCYGNGKFIAVTDEDNVFAYSIDGINWAESTISDTGRPWHSVCYGNDKFVAVADGDAFAYSTDGINWTETNSELSRRHWYSVCYGNGKFIAVTDEDNVFAYSMDGINWTEIDSGLDYRNWYSVCYGNGKFVAVAFDSNYFAYSTDGINWTETNSGLSSRYWWSVCYGNGKYVAVAYEDNVFAYSTDGINWTESTISDTSRYWWSVCYGNGKFVTVAAADIYCAVISNGPIHVTTEEKAKWNAGISKDDASTIVDTLKTEMTSYANEKINTSTQEVSNISDNVNKISSNIDKHIADSTIHITADDATSFDNKAAGDHKHLNDGHVTVSAANITGMIAVERLDPSVLERNYTVTSYEEMMALTKNEIQNGDSVFINGTKQSAWFVVDDTKLGTAEAFIQYAAPAKELTWENIEGKPSTLAEYNITTSYTKDEINTIYNNILASINEVKNKADEYNAAIGTEIPSDLDTTIATNTASANDLNSKVDILIRNTSLNDTFKSQLLSLVQNKVVGNIDIALNKTVTVSYVMNVDGGPGLSSGISAPASSVYTIDLENSSSYTHTVDTTYTSESVDDHEFDGYYTFSGWNIAKTINITKDSPKIINITGSWIWTGYPTSDQPMVFINFDDDNVSYAKSGYDVDINMTVE